MNAARALSTAVALLATIATLGTADARARPPVALQATEPACVAIVQPVTEGLPGKASDVAGGVRDLMAGYLAGSALKVISLESLLPSQAAAEARQKGCDRLLYLKLTKKTGGGRLTRAFGRAAANSSWALPYGGSAATAAARVAATASLGAVSSLADSTKAKDEVVLDYRVQSAEGAVAFGPRSEHQKASVDGEDIVTPVVARAAEAIVTRQAHQ